MRKLVLPLIFSFVFTLFAFPTFPGDGDNSGGPKQTWRQIADNPFLEPNFPEYNIQGVILKYNQLCLLGDKIRSTHRHVISEDYTDRGVFKLRFDFVYSERVYNEIVCTEIHGDECIKWDTRTVEIPLVDNIVVYKKEIENSVIHLVPAFEKEYQLPVCTNF